MRRPMARGLLSCVVVLLGACGDSADELSTSGAEPGVARGPGSSSGCGGAGAPGAPPQAEEIESGRIVGVESVVLGSAPALTAVPSAKFRHLLTVDRAEIESYRTIRNLRLE